MYVLYISYTVCALLYYIYICTVLLCIYIKYVFLGFPDMYTVYSTLFLVCNLYIWDSQMYLQHIKKNTVYYMCIWDSQMCVHVMLIIL